LHGVDLRPALPDSVQVVDVRVEDNERDSFRLAAFGLSNFLGDLLYDLRSGSSEAKDEGRSNGHDVNVLSIQG
jgi:hypothetical protein